MNELYISGYYGFGDNIWQRPHIVELAKKYNTIYLRTPFPDLYWDIENIKFVRPADTNSYHRELIAGYTGRWYEPPSAADHLQLNYNRGLKKNIPIWQSFIRQSGVHPKGLSIAIKQHWIDSANQHLAKLHINKPICVVKLPAVRSDYNNTARLPKIEYFQYVVDQLKHKYFMLGLGTVDGEWLVGDIQGIDTIISPDDIDIYSLTAMFFLSQAIMCTPSFALLLGVACFRPTITLYGGYVSPELHMGGIETEHFFPIAPKNFCNCNMMKHNCYKLIEYRDIDDVLATALGIVSKPKLKTEYRGKLLISRLRYWRAAKIRANTLINKHMDVIALDDHSWSAYTDMRCIQASQSWTEERAYAEFLRMLHREKITHAIIAQKEFHLSTALERACKKVGVKYLWCEAFFGDKLLYDYTGLQYTPDNDIVRYRDKVAQLDTTAVELCTREGQPPDISREEFFHKYQLKKNSNYIVVLGQLPWDMSLKFTQGLSYEEFMITIFERNPKTTFLFKHHPLLQPSRKPNTRDLTVGRKNVLDIDESLNSLFDIFKCFVSFSSTTIYEGTLRGCKFATGGYHFLQDITYSVRRLTDADNLYEAIATHEINDSMLYRYYNFINHYYSIRYDSEKLYHKLVMEPEKYYTSIWSDRT